MPGVGGFSFEDADQATAGLPAAAPRDIGFGGGVQAGFDAARSGPDWGMNQVVYEARVRADIESALKAKGYAPPSLLPDDRSTGGGQARAKLNAMLGALRQYQQRDPKFAPDLAGLGSAEDVTREAQRRRKIDLDDANERLAQTSGLGTIGGFAGQVGAGALDPLSYIPVGGGAVGATVARKILNVAAKEAAANAAITAISEPLVQRDAARLGIDRSAGDAITEIGAAAVFGGVLGGAAEGIGIGASRALDRRRAARAAAAGTDEERAMIDAVEAGIGTENLSPDERAAINVLRRDVEIREASPYTPTPEGDAAHKANLDQAAEMLRLAYTGSRAERLEALASLEANLSRAITSENVLNLPPDQASEMLRLAYTGSRAERAEALGKLEKNVSRATLPVSQAGLNRDSALDFIIDDLEGGAKRVVDSGGVTRYGISKNANPDVDVENLTRAQAKAIYVERYWKPLDLDRADPATAMIAFDAAINHGPGTAKKMLRQSGGDPAKFLALRRAEYARLIADDPGKYARYAKGWEDRLKKLEARLGDDLGAAPRAADDGADFAVEALGEAPPPVLRGDDAPAFDPTDYLDTLKDYVDNRRGSLSPDALGEALKLPPEQAQAVAFKLLEQGGTSGLVYQRSRFVDQTDAQGRVVRGDDGKPVQVLRDGVIRRAPRQLSAPREDDVLSFIARAGGIADDGADDIGGFFGKRRQKFIPGVGPLIRSEGRSVDEVGEALFEAGFIVGDERPTTADVLDLIDRASRGERIYRPNRAEAALAADNVRADDARWRATAEMRARNDAATAEFAKWDHEFSGDDMDRVMDMIADGFDAGDAAILVIRDHYGALLDEFALISDKPDYEIDYDASGQPIGEQLPPDSGFGSGAERPDDPFGNESAGREGDGDFGQDRGGTENLSQPLFDSATDVRLDGFDDPNGAGAAVVIQSLEHDLRMLIDESAEGIAFDIDDNGDVRNLADIMADFDLEDDAIAAARDCMVPVVRAVE